jgi:hypothetical protein
VDDPYLIASLIKVFATMVSVVVALFSLPLQSYTFV